MLHKHAVCICSRLVKAVDHLTKEIRALFTHGLFHDIIIFIIVIIMKKKKKN